MGSKETNVERLESLRGDAPRRSATVHALAQFASNARCPTARLAFAARVDLDRLLEGTRFAASFGQSPFAFRRGNRFEEQLRADDHRPLLALLQAELGYDTRRAKVLNLRSRGPSNRAQLEKRASATEEILRQIVDKRSGAPNLIDGAVLSRRIGGIVSHFEADAVAARFDECIRVGEVKSFPKVDGRVDPEKLGAALAQVAIYILLLRDQVERLGGSRETVSTEALLITPKNAGMEPTLTVKSVDRELLRAERILGSVPDTTGVVASLPPRFPGFSGAEARVDRSEAQRLEHVEGVIETVGNEYRPSCLSTCGLARLCRERAHRRGELSRYGGQLLRILPSVDSIDRVGALADGAAPRVGEEDAAYELRRVRSLLDQKPGPRAPAGLRRGA